MVLAGLGSFLVTRDTPESGNDAATIIAQHDPTAAHSESADRDRLLVTLADLSPVSGESILSRVMSTVALPRPAERVAIVSLVLVFLCGGLLGAVAMNYWVHPGLHGSAPGATGLSMSTKEWKEQLDLSEEQMRQLTSILDDFSRYYDYLLADGNSRVMQILNADQKVKYERMMPPPQKVDRGDPGQPIVYPGIARLKTE